MQRASARDRVFSLDFATPKSDDRAFLLIILLDALLNTT